MVDKLALEQVPILLSRLSCIILPMPSIQCRLNTALTQEQAGEAWGALKTTLLFGYRGALDTEVLLTL